MKNTVILLIGILFLFSCQKPEPKKIPNEIVLIFQEAKVQDLPSFKTGEYHKQACLVNYMDDDKIVRSIKPDSSLVYDTVVVSTHQASLEFVHNFRRIDKLSFIFQKGDTVLFRYRDASPYAEVLNRIADSISINYDLFWRQKISYSAFPAYKRSPIFEWIESPEEDFSPKKMKEEMDQIEARIYQAGEDELERELAILDSLRKEEILDSASYMIRKNKALFQGKQMELKSSLNFASRFQTEDKIKASDLRVSEVVDGLEMPVFTNVLDEKHSDLLAYDAYRELLKCYFLFYGRKVKRITERIDHNGQVGGLLNNPDFLERYDSIENSSMFSPDVKRLFLQWELENIIKFKSNLDKEEYLGRFEATFADSAVLDYLHETYTVYDIDRTGNQLDLKLLSSKGETLLYQELLKRHKGKVLYVDFWSRTCRPCINEMPASAKLKDSFQGKEVVFLYLSLDTNQDHWDKACDKYQLLEESYLIKNKFTSAEFERLKVDWIPHYMIYNKKGEQVVEYAPRPSEAESEELLQKYLSE